MSGIALYIGISIMPPKNWDISGGKAFKRAYSAPYKGPPMDTSLSLSSLRALGPSPPLAFASPLPRATASYVGRKPHRRPQSTAGLTA